MTNKPKKKLNVRIIIYSLKNKYEDKCSFTKMLIIHLDLQYSILYNNIIHINAGVPGWHLLIH